MTLANIFKVLELRTHTTTVLVKKDRGEFSSSLRDWLTTNTHDLDNFHSLVATLVGRQWLRADQHTENPAVQELNHRLHRCGCKIQTVKEDSPRGQVSIEIVQRRNPLARRCSGSGGKRKARNYSLAKKTTNDSSAKKATNEDKYINDLLAAIDNRPELFRSP